MVFGKRPRNDAVVHLGDVSLDSWAEGGIVPETRQEVWLCRTFHCKRSCRTFQTFFLSSAAAAMTPVTLFPHGTKNGNIDYGLELPYYPNTPTYRITSL